MAFLQLDIPPSTAPVGTIMPAAPAARAVAATPAAVSWTRSQRLAIRIVAGIAGGALLFIPGYAAAQATESIAMGILAADLAFLVAVAGWSSIAGSPRR